MGCAPSNLEEADSTTETVPPQDELLQNASEAVPVSAGRPGRAVEVIGEAASPGAPSNGVARSIPLLNEALDKPTDSGDTPSFRVKWSMNSLRNSASSNMSRQSSTSHGNSEKLPSLPGSVPSDEIIGTSQQALSTLEKEKNGIGSFGIKPLSSTVMSIKSLMSSPVHDNELADKSPEPKSYDKHLSVPISPVVLTNALDGSPDSSEVKYNGEPVKEQSECTPSIGSGKENVNEEPSLKEDRINGRESENGGVRSETPRELPPVTNDYDDCDHMYQNIEIRNGELYMGPEEVVELNERRDCDSAKNFQQILDENDKSKNYSDGNLENKNDVDTNTTFGDENNDHGTEPEQEIKKNAATHGIWVIGMNEQPHEDGVPQSSATSTVGTAVHSELLHTRESLNHGLENGDKDTGATKTEADQASHVHSTSELHATFPHNNDGTIELSSTLMAVLSPSSSPIIAYDDIPTHNDTSGLPDATHDPTPELLTTASASIVPSDDKTSSDANDVVAGPSNVADTAHGPDDGVSHGGKC